MKLGFIVTAAAVSVLSLTVPASANTAVGTLRCTVAGGVGLILGSSRRIECTFRPSDNSAAEERYVGRSSRIGLDVGVSGRSLILWKVIAPTSAVGRGALEGRFVGATAGAAVGIGGGANILVGGNNNTISLQPLSVNAKTGINIAAGIGSISLTLDD